MISAQTYLRTYSAARSFVSHDWAGREVVRQLSSLNSVAVERAVMGLREAVLEEKLFVRYQSPTPRHLLDPGDPEHLGSALPAQVSPLVLPHYT